MPAFQFVAIPAATFFTGAAIYINLAEHPARMECSTQLAATVFGPSYRRAAVMQIIFALAAAIGGISAWFLGAPPSVVRWRGVDLRRDSVHAHRDHADEQETPRSCTRSHLGSDPPAFAGLGKTPRRSEHSCSRGFGRFSVSGDLALNLAADS